MIFKWAPIGLFGKSLFSRQILLALLALFLSASSGCSGGEQNGKGKLESHAIAIEGKAGKVLVNAEFARTPAQQQQGLMYRKELNDGDGMLFIFEKDDMLSFWMKNTLIPLSIAYISSDGRIIEIFDMEPGNLSPIRSSRSVRYALEVPRGWFTRAGIEPGDILDTGNF